MTLPYENKLGWKRILVEGDPTYRKLLVDRSPQSFSANAAICEHHTQVHFSRGEYIGGILEFMNEAFMRDYHGGIYKKMVPPGNVSSITDWSAFPSVMLIDCIPLSVILHKARARHVNYFILDVEV